MTVRLIDGTKAAVLNGRVYIEGGEVSYYSGTNINFQYCKLTHERICQAHNTILTLL